MQENNIEAIKVKEICKSYVGKMALQNVSFTVRPGTIHGFIGPNGAGKTTSLGILTRLIIPTSGDGYIEGKSVANEPSFNENLGFVLAEPQLPNFSVEEYVKNVCYLRDIPESEALEKLDNSPLFEFHRKKCDELSTGWKKILQIFVLTLYKCQTLILDEPFNGLDPTFRINLIKQLIKFKEAGKTILISTHILSDLQEMADDITIIKEGKIVHSGPKPTDIKKVYEDLFFKEESSLFSL